MAVGHGAGELIRAALRAVATGEVEIVWPGWGLLPQLVDEAGATPVPVVGALGGSGRRSCAGRTIRPAPSATIVPAASTG